MTTARLGARSLRTGTNWYELVRTGTNWYELIRAGTNWYLLVPTLVASFLVTVDCFILASTFHTSLFIPPQIVGQYRLLVSITVCWFVFFFFCLFASPLFCSALLFSALLCSSQQAIVFWWDSPWPSIPVTGTIIDEYGMAYQHFLFFNASGSCTLPLALSHSRTLVLSHSRTLVLSHASVRRPLSSRWLSGFEPGGSHLESHVGHDGVDEWVDEWMGGGSGGGGGDGGGGEVQSRNSA